MFVTWHGKNNLAVVFKFRVLKGKLPQVFQVDLGHLSPWKEAQVQSKDVIGRPKFEVTSFKEWPHELRRASCLQELEKARRQIFP